MGLFTPEGPVKPYIRVLSSFNDFHSLDLFNLYVALSQSSGCETICLLHNFDNQMFLKTHDVALLAEDDQMERLDRIMKEWWQKMGCDKEQTENE